MNKIQIVLLAAIFSLGLFLRIYDISNTPPSLSHDESAIGYNAWSILETGKDEYGQSYPLLFRSFDDYKLPGYIYATSISMYFFGVNEFSVRFPSVFFGSLTVLILFFLTREMLRAENKEDKSLENILPFLAAFMLAISPWHINFSRAAFESNLSLFFIVSGLYLLFLSLKRKYFSFIAFLMLSASIYTYYTARVIVPLLLIFFVFFYRQKIKANLKIFSLACLLGLLTVLPLIPPMFTSGTARVNQVSIFESDIVKVPYWEIMARNNFSIPTRIFYNSYAAHGVHFAQNYLKNFSPEYYFVSGTGPMGLLHLWELPFFFLGIGLLFLRKYKWGYMLMVWFFGVVLVGGLTVGQPNALRTLPNAIPASVFTAFGIYFVWNYLTSGRKKKFFTVFLLIIISVFLFRFLSLYFQVMPYDNGRQWGDGQRQLAQYLQKTSSDFDNVYITGANWRPYIYLLFYSKYPPFSYQENGTRDGFENYSFGTASWDTEERDYGLEDLRNLPGVKKLFILTPEEYLAQSGSGKYKLLKLEEIKDRFGRVVFVASVIN